jgi:WD40 repeat protein
MGALINLSWDRWPRRPLEAAALFVVATIVFDAIHFALHRCLNSRWTWLRKLASPHQAHHDFCDRRLYDHTLILLDLETGELRQTFLGHKDWVSAVAITSDARCALTGSHDSTLRLWELETGRQLRVFAGHRGKVHSVAVAPDGRYALSASQDRTLKLWDVETG